VVLEGEWASRRGERVPGVEAKDCALISALKESPFLWPSIDRNALVEAKMKAHPALGRAAKLPRWLPSGRSTVATSGLFASPQMSMHTRRASFVGPIAVATLPSFTPLRLVVGAVLLLCSGIPGRLWARHG